MARYLAIAFPALLLLLASFGVVVELMELEPRPGAVLRLALFDAPRVPALVVLGTWIMEACGLLALFLLAQGRCGSRWLDGLVAGWLAWVFRGPLFVLTIAVATRQPQDPWWDLAFAWWILYSVCGLAMAALITDTDVPDPEAAAAALATATPTAAVETPIEAGRSAGEETFPGEVDSADEDQGGSLDALSESTDTQASEPFETS